MIYSMSRDIADGLKDRGFTAPVYYGPEYAQRMGNETGIVVQRDRDIGDTFGTPRGAQRSIPVPFARTEAVLVHIHGQSSGVGAAIQDHEALCDQYLDGFLTELYSWAKRILGFPPTITSGRFLRADERSGEQTWPSAVYELRFQIVRPVRNVKFEGDGPDTTTIADFNNEHTVKQS